jgi:hypothetical protein
LIELCNRNRDETTELRSTRVRVVTSEENSVEVDVRHVNYVMYTEEKTPC